MIDGLHAFIPEGGPECYCGYHGWFIGQNEVRCSHCDRYRIIEGVKGYLLEDGPTCGCKRVNWFVGKSWAKCGRCERDKHLREFEIEDKPISTHLGYNLPSGFLSSLGLLDSSLLANKSSISSRTFKDRFGIDLGQIVQNPNINSIGFEAPMGSGLNFSGFKGEYGMDPMGGGPGFTVRDGDGNPIGFINDGLGGPTFSPFGDNNPFIRMP